MIFTSWAFVRFFIVVLVGLWLARTRSARQLLLLVASAYFYAYTNPWYLLLLATPSVIDYVCAIHIEDAADPRVRKRWLLFSLITNLGLLGYFKYTGFFADSIAALIGVSAPHLAILLPIGISFYTFKTLSYTIDVYRREIPASRALWQYAMFVMYFPELVAGPIVRASVFLPQMGRTLKPSWPRAIVGTQVILLGVTKKVLIADRLAMFVDPVFAAPAGFSPLTVASAIVAYSLQIYCDFSGYSDIAIGVSRIIGFDLPENFNMPYLSVSITEFWRRWHITLSSWLRDYLYIPLGGNRKGRVRTYINLFLTMLLGGLWHGAGWTFVCWGILHGVGLAVHKLWSGLVPKHRRPFGGVVGWAATYGFVCLAWIFFRAHDLPAALLILRKVTGLAPGGVPWLYLPLVLLLPFVVFGHLLGVVVRQQEHKRHRPGRYVPVPGWAVRWYHLSGSRFAIRPHPAAGAYLLLPLGTVAGGFLITAWVLLLALFAPVVTNPFIYFRF
jgi:alginate O-acetyltransferase complex protein AlgI